MTISFFMKLGWICVVRHLIDAKIDRDIVNFCQRVFYYSCFFSYFCIVIFDSGR